MAPITPPGPVESVLGAFGGTPLIRLAWLAESLPAPVYAKVEFLSPGGSVKDRLALAMMLDAERSGAVTRAALSARLTEARRAADGDAAADQPQ